MVRRDQERLDWLEAQLRRTDIESTNVLLTAWWSGPDAPDGFAVAVGTRDEPDANEWPTLRQAIDEAMIDEAGGGRNEETVPDG